MNSRVFHGAGTIDISPVHIRAPGTGRGYARGNFKKAQLPEDQTMAIATGMHNRSISRTRGREGLQFRLIFFATFIIFLVAAVIERLLPRSWRSRPTGGSGKSIFSEAREAAGTYAPYAFMG